MENVEQSVVVRQESSGMMSVKQVADRVNAVHQILEKVMRNGTHYGTVPGCGNKMVLLKPGADVLAMTFRLVPQFKVERTDLPDGHREFDVTCSMFNPAGELLGQGVGSASTMEKKYRYRWEGAGNNRKQVENSDIADVYNTVLKIAKKRAHIDATLTVTGAADLFTQDLIDEDEQKPPVTMPKEKPTPGPAPAADRPPDREPPGELPLDAAGEYELAGVIKNVSRKPGKSAKGDYIKCGVCIVTDNGEQWANTFDTALADDAEGLKGRQAILHVKQGKYGLDLISVGAPA